MLLLAAAASLFFLPSPWGVVAVIVAVAVEVLEIGFWRRFLRRYRVQTGSEGLLGMHGEVVDACAPVGRVRLRGELWKARSDSPLDVGTPVRVSAVDGLTLAVEPLGDGTSG